MLRNGMENGIKLEAEVSDDESGAKRRCGYCEWEGDENGKTSSDTDRDRQRQLQRITEFESFRGQVA